MPEVLMETVRAAEILEQTKLESEDLAFAAQEASSRIAIQSRALALEVLVRRMARHARELKRAEETCRILLAKQEKAAGPAAAA